MLKCHALKMFLYSADGTTAILVQVGDEPSIPNHLVAGLVAEGYIVGAGHESPSKPVFENKIMNPLENKDVEVFLDDDEPEEERAPVKKRRKGINK